MIVWYGGRKLGYEDRLKFQSYFCQLVTFLNLLDFSLLIHYILYVYICMPSNIYLVVMFWRLNRTNNIKYLKLWLNSHTINKINTFLFHSNQRNFCLSKNYNSINNIKKCFYTSFMFMNLNLKSGWYEYRSIECGRKFSTEVTAMEEAMTHKYWHHDMEPL